MTHIFIIQSNEVYCAKVTSKIRLKKRKYCIVNAYIMCINVRPFCAALCSHKSVFLSLVWSYRGVQNET